MNGVTAMDENGDGVKSPMRRLGSTRKSIVFNSKFNHLFPTFYSKFAYFCGKKIVNLNLRTKILFCTFNLIVIAIVQDMHCYREQYWLKLA